MSIMLRKECQTVLDEYGWTNLHANINSHSKQLQIYTPCGKPFAPVHGVQFSRMQPTLAEIEYTVELLRAWMERNADRIDEYTDLLAELEACPEPDLKGKNFEINTQNTYDHSINQHVASIKSISVFKGFVLPKRLRESSRESGRRKVTWNFHLNGNLYGIVWERTLPQTAFNDYVQIPEELLKVAQEQVVIVQKYMDLKASVESFRAELNSCTD